MARFLRSRRLRALLWYAADGLCRRCGRPLSNLFHADHVVPYVVSGRTNFDEMQALCPACNLRKGSRHMRLKTDRMRPGQRLAYEIILDRIIQQLAYTAIVLPTRYGKSDVIRCSAITLFQNVKVSAVLVLSPNAFLRDQIINKEKVAAMLQRYEIKFAERPKFTRHKKLVPDLAANGECVVSVTIQMVQRNIDAFVKWVKHMHRKTGLPVMVCIDEAHTGSEDNDWGDAVRQLVEAGALAVLFTATAMRSDGKLIHGFEAVIISEQHVERKKYLKGTTPETVTVEEYEGTERLVKLVADHETTFREAWAEIPSPICKVGHVPFEVHLQEIQGVEFGDKRLLSELSPHETRQHIGKIVRDGHTIRAGVLRCVEILRQRQRVDRSQGAIVFCGNDSDTSTSANEHPNLIAACFNSVAPDLKVLIATSYDGGEGEGKSIIERFQRGEGDILIVKQMASVGLDVERLKVALDLSPIRTRAAFIQRLMRIATLFGHIQHGVYISPADCLSRALFDDLIRDQGGAAQVSDLELVNTYEIPKGEDSGDKKTFIVNGTGLADFADSNLNRADKEKYLGVNFILDRFPEINNTLSHAEIAGRIDPTFAAAVCDTAEGVEDTSAEVDSIRSDIGTIVKSITKVRVRLLPYSRELWESTVRDVWTEVYRAAGAPPKTSLPDVTDLSLLARIKAAAEAVRDAVEDVA